MDSKDKAWAQYLSDSGYAEVRNTGEQCVVCDGGTIRIVEISGKRYEMCHVCHISRPEGQTEDAYERAGNMAKFKALLAQGNR